jgi:predicted O-methyltransferase YrrM
MLNSTLRPYLIALRHLLIGANLKAITKSPAQAAYYARECLFLNRAMYPNGDLPQKAVWEVLGASSELPIVICPTVADEWFRSVASYSADLIGLCAIAQIIKPKVIFEIGTYKGSGAIHLAANAPDATVYTLDLAPNEAPQLNTTIVDQAMMGTGGFSDLGDRIHRLYGDSATFDFIPYHGRVDLFFIDGAHSYEYVRSDTIRALKCVHKESVIAWHDYGRYGVNGVSRWLHEYGRGRRIYRVPGGSLAYMVC